MLSCVFLNTTDLSHVLIHRLYRLATNDNSRIHEISERKSYLILCLRLQVLEKMTRRILVKDGSGKSQIRIILD